MDYSIIINAVVLSTFLVVLFEYFWKKRKDPEYVHPIDRMWRGGSLNALILVVGAVAAFVLLVRSLGNEPMDPKIFEYYEDVEEVEIAFNWPQEHWIDSIQEQLDHPFCYGEVVNVRMPFASGTVIAPWVSGQYCTGDYHLMDVSVIMVLLNAERKVLIDDKIVALAELEDSVASKLRNDRSLSFNKLTLFSAQFDDETLEEDRAALFEGVMRGYEAYCEVLAHENFGVGLRELDPDTWRTLDQRFAFVAQAFLPPPPPPPPVDVILNEPTFIGFVPDSLQLDSAMNALGEENFYIGMDDHAWFTYQLLEKTLAADVPVIWEYGAALSYLIPGDVDDRRLIKDPSELFQYFYFDGDSLFETNIFLEGTPLENYEVHRDSIDIDPAVYSAIPGAGDENNRQQWWVDDCRNCLKLSDTLELDMNDNGVSEYIFFDLGYCTSLVIREEGAEDIRIGCNIPQQNDLPETVDWVNMWYPVTEREVHETTFDNDEGLGERKVKLDNYGFFIGKEEAGGGVIGYVNGELVYLHQGC